MSCWSLNQALIAKAATLTRLAPTGVRRLGVDEIQDRTVHWFLAAASDGGQRRQRSDPWTTRFVDLDPKHAGGLLGWQRAGPVRA